MSLIVDDDSEIVQIPEQNGEAPLKTKEQKQEGYKISQGSKLEIEVMRNIQKKDLEVEEFYPDDAMDECKLWKYQIYLTLTNISIKP